MKIDDGTGTSKQAKVSGGNRLATDAITVEEITSISSNSEGAYLINVERQLTTEDTFQNVTHITYTGDFKLQIDDIRLSKEDVALGTGRQAVVEISTKVAYTSGGELSPASNMNLGSSNSLSADIYSGEVDLVVDESSKIRLMYVPFQESKKITLKGSLILNKNDTLSISGKSKNEDDTIHVSITAFEVKEVI